MPDLENQDHMLFGAAAGRQAQIGGAGDAAEDDGGAPLAGQTLTEGTYTYELPVSGAAAVDVTLKASSVTGTIAPTIYPTYVDGLTAKGTPVAFDTLANDTLQTKSIETLRGERVVMLEIVVGAGESVTFSQAEYSAL
jgi:hypothetical protein